MTLPNPQETTTRVNTDWQAHARPIMKAYLAMEEACMASAICEVHYGKDWASKSKTSDYREADGYRKEAQGKLYDMIEGIRDNYLCDNYVEVDYSADDDAIDAQEEFNDALKRDVVSVEVAVRVLEDER